MKNESCGENRVKLINQSSRYESKNDEPRLAAIVDAIETWDDIDRCG